MEENSEEESTADVFNNSFTKDFEKKHGAQTLGVIYKRNESWPLSKWDEFIAEDVNDQKFGWQNEVDLRSLESGYNCKVWTRESVGEDEDLSKSVRLEATFTNSPNHHPILDFYTKDNPQLGSKIKLVEKLDGETDIYYQELTMPGPLRNRDCVFEFGVKSLGNGDVYYTLEAAEHDGHPVRPG